MTDIQKRKVLDLLELHARDYPMDIKPAIELIQELTAREAKAVKALGYYADRDKYNSTREPYFDNTTAPPVLTVPLGYPNAPILSDAGKIASATLEELKKGE